MYHYLEMYFPEVSSRGQNQFFGNTIFTVAIFRLLLQYAVTAAEELSVPAVLSLYKLCTVRP